MAKPLSEKAKKEEERKAEQQALTEGQRRQARQIPRSATAFPTRKSRVGGSLTRDYAVGDYPDTLVGKAPTGKKGPSPTPPVKAAPPPKVAPGVPTRPMPMPPKIAVKPIAQPIVRAPLPLKPSVAPLPPMASKVAPAYAPKPGVGAPVVELRGQASTANSVGRVVGPYDFQQGPLPVPSNAGRGSAVPVPVSSPTTGASGTQKYTGGVKTSYTNKPPSGAAKTTTTATKTTTTTAKPPSGNTQKTTGGVKTSTTKKPEPKPKPKPAPKKAGSGMKAL